MEGTERGYVTLDDLNERNIAKTDPELFLQLHKPPVLIDEVQYAPELFTYIKMHVDKNHEPGAFWLIGSQVFKLMRGVQESLAGRVAVLSLTSLSQAEISGGEMEPFSIEMEALNERKKKILQIIIEDYISTAEPVGSRTIARKHDLGLSPATIRNEMSDLELLGYLEQPHTSAGRVPSAQAYRFYVDSMIEPDTLDDNDRTLINTLYRERQRSIDDIFLSTAKILSQMTHNVSMVLANQHSISRFCYLKFLPLDTNHAILCIVTDDGNVNNCVVEIPAGMSAKELEYMAGRITRMLEGKAVTDIDKALLDEVQAAVKDDRLLLSSLLHVLRRMTRPEKETFFMGGTRQLLSQPEFRDMEKVKNLLGVLEEEKVVRNILKSGEESGLRITIGSENKFEGIQDCSMVQATYRLNGKIVGTMAVLGPTRMQYGKVIAVMDYLHKYLKTILNS